MGIAATDKEQSASAPHLLAADLMTSPAVVARDSETVHDAARLMHREGVGAVPVVDASGAAVGMVSDGDLSGRERDARRGAWWLEWLANGGSGDACPPQGDVPVRKVMSAPLIGVPPRASIQEIAEALRVHRVKRLPVIEDGRAVGIVSRADLLRVVESIPRKSAEAVNEGNPLSFFESLIGGASLSGRLERPVGAASDPHAEPQAPPRVLSAEAFRESVRACRRQSLDSKQLARREAELERRRQVETLLEQRLSEQLWHEMLDRADLAARSGEREFMLLRFPADLCSDGGRRINVVEQGWEETLRGEAAEIYHRWRKELKPKGFGLSARIVSFEDGIIGDIGLYLSWGE